MPIETLEFEGGGSYTGETDDGVPHGKGKFTWDNGDIYEGDWVNNVQQGYGTFRWANGDVYEGEWKDDKADGKGKMTFKNGNVYEGGWVQDKMHGKGVLRLRDGRVYEGEMRRDKKHGRGKETLPNGEYYEGEWVDGKKEGKGLYVWPNGDRYDGDYKNDVKEGKGVFRWANGDTYEGEVKNGVKHGKGIHRYQNGDYYAGNFVNGKEDGKQKLHKAGTPLAADATISMELSMIDLGSSSHSGAGSVPVPKPAPPEIKSRFDFTSESVGDIDLKSWKRGSSLGRGSFGEVFLGLLRNGKFVAVKTVEFGNETDNKDLESFRSELDLMKMLQHKNIIRFLGSEYNKEENVLNIFMEYAPSGSLAAVTKKFNTLPSNTVRLYTKQILEGLKYLHEHKIIHRDIKGDNILLDSEGTVKLADFGCSTRLDAICSKTHGCNTMVGTPFWMAPEVITNEGGYGFGADIWSVGCTVVEMLTAKPPWHDFVSMWAAIYHIANSTGPPTGIPVGLEPDLQQLLDLCFQREPSKRPSAVELLKLPAFASV